MAEAASAGLVLGLDVEAARLERVAGDAAAEHRLVLGFGWRLEGAPASAVAFETRLEASHHDYSNDGAEHRIVLTLTARW